MTIEAEVVTVGDTATALHDVDDGPSGARLYLSNAGGGAVTLGGINTVTFGGGYDLAAGATLEVVVAQGDQLFAISGAAASNDVHVMRTGE